MRPRLAPTADSVSPLAGSDDVSYFSPANGTWLGDIRYRIKSRI